MRQEDIPQVQALDRASFNMPWPDSAYNYELNENPGSLLWVAEVPTTDAGTNKIVGMVVVWMILDEAHIATIAVHPEYRRCRVAQKLLTVALKGAIQAKAAEATLEVRASNIAAQNLYRKFHFDVVGKRVRYYRDNNEDALIMTIKGLGENYRAWLEHFTALEGSALENEPQNEKES